MNVPKTKLFGQGSQACDARGTRGSTSAYTCTFYVPKRSISTNLGAQALPFRPVTRRGLASCPLDSISRGEETLETRER